MSYPGHTDAMTASTLSRAAVRALTASGQIVRRLLIAEPLAELPVPPGMNIRWVRAREQILTGLLRVGVLLGTPALIGVMVSAAGLGMFHLILLYLSLFAGIVVLTLRRELDYRVRGGLLLGLVYLLGAFELLSFGYSEDAYGALVAFSLITPLLFGGWTGRAALLLSFATLLGAGWALSVGALAPAELELRVIGLPLAISTSLFFVAVVGSVQFGVSALMHAIEEAWQQAQQARSLLQHERDLLEQRVAERTHELAALAQENARLYATALREVDERRQAERALQQQAEALQAQNRELDAFAHTVAHDLKSPLTQLVVNSQLLQMTHRDMPADELDAELGGMTRAGFKISSIIEALLLLAHARAGSEVLCEPLLMREIMASARARVLDAAEAAGATIALPTSWPLALGYAPWVEEVWVNYLSNAIKYGGPRPAVAAGAEQQADGSVRFWVQDAGPGLSAEEQARLFTPFTRLHTASAPGHGLGLSIVQRIVTRLGGEAGVESAPGQGSRFFFTLPGAGDAPEA